MALVSITDIQDPRLAIYRDLPQKNPTRRSGRFIAEGEKVVLRLIASRYPVESILAEPEFAERVSSLTADEVPIYVASRDVLEATVGFNFHRGALACGRRLPGLSVAEFLGRSPAERITLVVSPDVQDPTNLGSIIRTTAAFGCHGILLGSRCADPFSRRVLRVSMGTAFQVPIVESRDLPGDLRQLIEAGFDLAATVLDPVAQHLSAASRGERLAILLGSEGHGLSPEIQARCSQRVTIPMQPGVDSLNVAVAAAVFLHHFTRVPTP
jgi:tRNA G18 (ribose-2'-O)-methylase SpoU